MLAFGKEVYILGAIAPGATNKVELSGDRYLANHLKDKAAGYVSDQLSNRDMKINRADLLLAAMFHDSEASRAAVQSLGNSTLHDLDLTGQLALDRPMLLTRIKRPGAQLVLDNPPSPPRIDQTTMLRIILPLQRNHKDDRRADAGARPGASAAAGPTALR